MKAKIEIKSSKCFHMFGIINKIKHATGNINRYMQVRYYSIKSNSKQ